MADTLLEAAKARATRLKRLREYLGFSRKMLEKRHGISSGSLQNWEDVRYGGLTQKGALSLVKAFQAEGIHCTFDWLYNGDGVDPLSDYLSARPTQASVPKSSNKASLVTQELQFFHQLHPNSIDTILKDDSMEPRFSAGDIIAGIRYFHPDLEQLVGLDCIIQTKAGETLVRRLQSGTKPGYFKLMALNPSDASANDLEIEIFSAAPIIWVRRDLSR